MTEISCEMCMDLMPLVQDSIASEDSCEAVRQHITNCADCRAMFEGEVPPPTDDLRSMKHIKRKMQVFGAMVLTFGVLFGLSLTASAGLFYNILIMPIVGALGYAIFRWNALYTVPLMLLVTHLLMNGLSVFQGAEKLDFPSLLYWTMLYCGFAVIGIVIAGLLHFGFRKER